MNIYIKIDIVKYVQLNFKNIYAYVGYFMD